MSLDHIQHCGRHASSRFSNNVYYIIIIVCYCYDIYLANFDQALTLPPYFIRTTGNGARRTHISPSMIPDHFTPMLLNIAALKAGNAAATMLLRKTLMAKALFASCK